MNKNAIKQNIYAKNIIRDKWLIISITAAILCWGVIYLFTLYKPVYTSNSRVWVKNLPDQTFVDINSEKAPIPSQNQEINPMLTQLEILSSRRLLTSLVEYINKEYPADLKNIKDKEAAVAGMLKAKNKTGTEIIDVNLKSDSPEKSKVLLGVALKEYENINLTLNKKINSQRRQFVDKQLIDIGNRLIAVRNKIRQYRIGTLSTSIDDESSGLVKQKIDFLSQLENVKASINDSQGKISALENKLNLNVQEALNAVALGSENANLRSLREKLNDVQQQYSHDSINLAITNPSMSALRNKIETIKSQIQDQIRLTLGKNLDRQEIDILDPVREKLTEELAMSHANLTGLRGQRNSLLSSISSIVHNQSKIPNKKFILDNLLQEERNLSLAYDELRVKQIEARLKEAETVSNITVVDKPDLPVSKSFPTAKHILVLAVMIGGILGIGASLLKTNIEDICEGANEVEEITKSPVLGAIPWSKNPTDEKSKLLQSFAVKNIVSNLISKYCKNEIKVINFASTSPMKSNSFFIYTLASCIKQLGYSVVVVDADLEVPLFLKDASGTDNIKGNLSDLILDVEARVKHGLEIDEEYILSMLTSGKNDLKLLGNKDNVQSSYEYFGSSAFSKIISILKDNFDWVLIDSPSATIAPEFSIISRSADGIILLTDFKVTYSTLHRVTRMLKDADINLIGTIIREQNSILEKDFDASIQRQSIISITKDSEEETKV